MTDGTGSNQDIGPRIDIKKNPTPDDEGGFFSSPDEAAKNAAHRRNQEARGPVGRLLGSSNPMLNVGVVMFSICASAMAISSVALIWAPGASTVIDNLFKLMLAIVGFVGGSLKSAGKDE